MRTDTDFNSGWLFALDREGNCAGIGFDDSSWRPVTLPHDWSAEYAPREDAPTGGGGGFATAGIGWYRKHFALTDIRTEERASLRFDGVYMDAAVYCNGKKVGWHGCGYSSFMVDLTDSLAVGDNVVAVRVDNSHQPNSRWYSGSGIYRRVTLVRTARIHMEPWGVRCCTNGIYPTRNTASLQIRALLRNDSDSPVHAGVIHKLLDRDGQSVCTSGASLWLDSGDVSDCMTRPSVTSPHLWTVEDPYLYTLVSTVVVDGEPVDEITSRVGIRTAAFDCDKGFLLNGQQVKIKGMCLHHDCGITGAAGYMEIWRRRLSLLRDMGCNGIRCAHNPPDPLFLDLCDEMGFLVMDEFFDEWMLSKNKTDNYYSQAFAYGSSRYFERYAEEELTTMLRRDFNHPSVILWSIGNEIPEQSSLDGVKILKFLQDICHHEDPSRMVTSACDNIAAVEDIKTLREFENALDVVGYNYVGRWRERAESFYDEDRHMFPNRRMIGSENPSVGGRRGDYSGSGFFGHYADATLQHEALWRYTVSRDFVAGDYLWTGIDYLGETRWPSRGAPCGPIDTAGFPKDSYYYFKSIWNRDEVTLHLLPHWNWRGQEGQFKQVVCYTNCEKVSLYLNDRLIGTKGFECPRVGAENAWYEGFRKFRTTNDLHLVWDVPYEPGTLRAEGYRNGKVVLIAEVKTTGEATTVEAVADRGKVHAGELVHIDISFTDEQGRQVPDAEPTVFCKIQGPARLVGMDSGDLTDLSLYSLPQRKALSGRLLALIEAVGRGKVTVTFSADKLNEKSIDLFVE